MNNTDNSRERSIVKISVGGMIVNIILAAVKFILGQLSGSVAISSDAVNSITDSSSSLITIIGTKLAQKKPDKKHPFGYGRIEYLASLIIGVMVVVTGVEATISAVKSIISPEEVDYAPITLIVLGISIAVKIFLGLFTQKAGKWLQSGALEASGKDAVIDAIMSAVTIISAIIFIITKFSIDAYAGAFISLLIIKAGLETLWETLNKILGERADKELSDALYADIRAQDGIIGAYDLILNNYGPRSFIGSINVEVDENKRAGELYPFLHRLQVRIYREYRVFLVFGIYAVDNGSDISAEIHRLLDGFKQSEPHCLSYHGIVTDSEQKQIYCDIVLDFDCDRAELSRKASELIKAEYPEYEVNVTVDTEFA